MNNYTLKIFGREVINFGEADVYAEDGEGGIGLLIRRATAEEKALREKEAEREKYGQLEYVMTDIQRDKLLTCTEAIGHYVNVFSVCKKKDIKVEKIVSDLMSVRSSIVAIIQSYDHFKEKRDAIEKEKQNN